MQIICYVFWNTLHLSDCQTWTLKNGQATSLATFCVILPLISYHYRPNCTCVSFQLRCMWMPLSWKFASNWNPSIKICEWDELDFALFFVQLEQTKEKNSNAHIWPTKKCDSYTYIKLFREKSKAGFGSPDVQRQVINVWKTHLNALE